MGWFGSSKKRKEAKELKEARQHLKQLDKRKHHKMMSSSNVDPAKALNEAQPWQVNQEKTTQSLSTQAHKDVWGNPIKEPDLTNPTRSRWERPLDTIRGFQDSIDRGYKRSSYYGEDSSQPPTTPQSQHPSAHQNWNQPRGVPPPNGSFESSSADGYYNSNNYNNYNYNNHNNYNNNNNSGYSAHYAYRAGQSATPLSASSDDANSGFGVGAMGGRTALNETMVMTHRARYSHGSSPDTGYGSVDHGSHGGSSSNTIDQEMMGGSAPAPTVAVTPLGHQPLYASPTPPEQAVQAQHRNVIKLSDGAGAAAPREEEKRKSWFGRRFSKN